jgi:DNA (cytosine-5)-methyltransferase 1
MSALTLTDLFAGFGGASSGAVQVPGVDLVIAANHWQLAVDVHNSNHPTADHACVDLHLEDPAYFPTTDVLWASPECTQWSQANGKKPDLAPILGGWSLFDDLDDDLKVSEDAATRSRLLMFDVLRFVEHHRYRYGVVENVVDIARNPKYAAPWEAWQVGLRNLGYQYTVVSLNSMHAQAAGDPAPQSRDRIYVVFWRNDQRAPDLAAFMRPRGFCGRCDTVVETFQAWKPGRSIGKYRQQYVYLCTTPGCGEQVEPGFLPAAAAIDWSMPGKRIGDRDKDLATKTRARIAAGIARYWSPFHLEAGGNQYDAADPKHPAHGDPNAYYRTWPVDDVLKTLHTQESKALAVPAGGTWNDDARPLSDPHRTMTTRDTTAVVAPQDAFLLERRFEYRTRSLEDPMATLTANDTSKALLQRPFIAELRGGGSSARPTSRPMSTVTASGNHHALVMRNNSAKGGNPARHVTPSDEYLRTLVAEGPLQSLIMRNNGSKGDGGEMVTPAGSYLRPG